ncbi:MAG TPA: hybrid sensor histidine kinase/response regulator [Alphaproteobacteria bacterium]|nr:hybrid sensor histidine kinase/response regulator [Alphaproteobacteria bacterium]
MNDILAEFLTETYESIGTLDVELVKLEQDPDSPELLSKIFRLVHTIKGTCGFLGLVRLESVAHAAEDVLGRYRDGDLAATPSSVSVILRALDTIKVILAALEQTGAEPEGDDGELIATLNAIAAGEPAGTLGAPPVVEEPVVALEPTVGSAQPEAPVPETPVVKEVEASAPPSRQRQAPEPEKSESAVALQSIRVNVDLLESLMTTVSELVLTRNQLLQIARAKKDSEFAAPLQRLNQVVSELQEGVMKTRMQPIGNAWTKLPRIIRDLAHELNKKIDLQMIGSETELDRQVLELIKDPLTHMVRNSADHGIESPHERAQNGKSETGRIWLKAFHQGGHIIIEIGDDGRGLNIDKIKAKVLAKGLATEAELTALNDAQVQQFIFRPGFSTAEAVTSVSGRGVGMDVVRTNIEKIGGTIEMKSIAGHGSTFTIKIPLTLAIVSALIVEVAGDRYAIPQTAVVELVRATEAGTGEHRIERLKGAPVLRLRDRLLPLVGLESLLKLERADNEVAPTERFVVVTQVGVQAFGMIVDRVFDTEEIVVKPVAPVVRQVSTFSGNTILGDGSVIMILDPNGIAATLGEIMGADENMAAEAKARASDGAEQTTLLVFSAGAGGPKAVPLSLIARLEEFDRSAIEWVNGQSVIQYRGKLTPLVPFIDGALQSTEGQQPALIFADEGWVMGLMVDEIIDIVDTHLDIQLRTDMPGILGSAIVAGRGTDIIDVSYHMNRAFAHSREGIHGDADDRPSRRVLVVDDSPFYRNLVASLLKVEGYQVTSTDGAAGALALCEAGEKFDLIISDLDMPGMSGFDFAVQVKHDERWRETPVVAMSSLTEDQQIDRARECGFDDYVVKFDRSTLLDKLSQTVRDGRKVA